VSRRSTPQTLGGALANRRRVDFARIAAAALRAADRVVLALLPDGHREGSEWVARNPLRNDRRPGSFKVNLVTGKWGDFALGTRGKDLISLAAYCTGVGQREAAVRLADALGVDPFE
jgi:hypothetical protein